MASAPRIPTPERGGGPRKPNTEYRTPNTAVYRVLLWAILILVLVRLFWRVVKGVLEGMGYQRPGGRQSVGLVRDPVCGMFVAPGSALTSGTGSNTRYFCSEKCRQQYSKHG